MGTQNYERIFCYPLFILYALLYFNRQSWWFIIVIKIENLLQINKISQTYLPYEVKCYQIYTNYVTVYCYK